MQAIKLFWALYYQHLWNSNSEKKKHRKNDLKLLSTINHWGGGMVQKKKKDRRHKESLLKLSKSKSAPRPARSQYILDGGGGSVSCANWMMVLRGSRVNYIGSGCTADFRKLDASSTSPHMIPY